MKIENLFLKRIKELPSDATTSGHKLALKGGYIHQTVAGCYTYSHISVKLIENIKNVIKKHLNKLGCLEINMPVVSSLSLWKETQRDNIDVLLKFKTRAGMDCVLNPTHEEIVCDYVRESLQSYKQLPKENSLCLYQIQTKYRDELRARAGLLRCREFMMKDAYSFHQTDDDLNNFYQKMLSVYVDIYKELGLDNVIVAKATGGDMGGAFSHEFQMLDDTGEDDIYLCEKCNNNYNKEILNEDDDPICLECKNKFIVKRGIEVGNIFRLGTKYSKPMNLKFTDENGKNNFVTMGCYGIGVSRVLGCLLQSSCKDSVAEFNLAVAPYKVHIINLDKNGDDATKLYETLINMGIDTIIDNSKDSAGSKFANADLLGAPIKIINSPKNLEKGVYELKYSKIKGNFPAFVKTTEIINIVKDIIAKN